MIENPPYIRQEDIRDLTLPKEIGEETENKKLYKAKLARSVYQVHPQFFGYQHKKDLTLDKPEKAVKKKLNGRSDLYIFFFFHGLSLLNAKGSFCCISSNSWLDAGFGADLKEFLITQCHLKKIIDNTARRSFKGVNINTIISLISCPENIQQKCLEYTTKFVNFTVPFEVILDRIIFYEIETATKRLSRVEHTTNPILQSLLLELGINEQKQKTSESWGGIYFKSPDIYWTILEKGRDKFKSIEDIAKIRRGITTGANKFFILDSQTISKWKIETEFIRPFIMNLDESNSIQILPNELQFYIFICGENKFKLKGTAALEYIEWAESQGFHESRSCKIRQPWYKIAQRPLPHLCFPRRTPSTTAKTYYIEDGCFALDRFIEVNVPHEMRIPLCYYLNSTIFNLIINVNGRSSLGYGTIEIQAVDLKTLLCIDPGV